MLEHNQNIYTMFRAAQSTQICKCNFYKEGDQLLFKLNWRQEIDYLNRGII